MKLAVSDTTPLNYLVLIDGIEALGGLFERLYVPSAVIQELKHPKAPRAVSQWAANPPEWVEIRAPGNELDVWIGKGENEAISLALEMPGATLLIDDMIAREEADSRGIATLGTLAILDLADDAGLLDFESATVRLRSTTFHLSERLYQSVLAKVRLRKRR